jgi:hypothetical protein
MIIDGHLDFSINPNTDSPTGKAAQVYSQKSNIMTRLKAASEQFKRACPNPIRSAE